MKKVVIMFIKNKEGDILLQKRTKDYKKFPSKWTLFGGEIEKGETSIEAIKREMIEELGIELEVQLITTSKINVNGKQEFVFVYSCELNDISKIRLGEGVGMAFFNKEEIEIMECYPKEEIIKWLNF